MKGLTGVFDLIYCSYSEALVQLFDMEYCLELSHVILQRAVAPATQTLLARGIVRSLSFLIDKSLLENKICNISHCSIGSIDHLLGARQLTAALFSSANEKEQGCRFRGSVQVVQFLSFQDDSEEKNGSVLTIPGTSQTKTAARP